MKQELARKQQPSLKEKRPRRPRSASIKLPRKQSNPNTSGDCFNKELKLLNMLRLFKDYHIDKRKLTMKFVGTLGLNKNIVVSENTFAEMTAQQRRRAHNKLGPDTSTDLWNELLKYTILNKENK